MKKILNIIIVACLTLGVSSCNLDRYPFDAIEHTQAFKTVKDATAFNNAMYATLRDRVYGIHLFGSDVQSDLLHASTDFGNRQGSIYRWDFIDSDYAISDIWSQYYSALTNINNFLDNVDNITITTSSADEAAKEKSTLANCKGEACFLRAYYYYQLVKRYAKDYEPATAASDLGVPMMLHFNLSAQPSRATVEEVYTQILSDLTTAKSLITTEGKLGSNRITKDCITALEARVYLTSHKYTDAVTAVNTLINSGRYPLVNTQDDLRNVWHKDAIDESIFMLFASQPSELALSNSIYLGFTGATNKYTPDFIPEQWVIDLFDDADLRKQIYLEKKPVYLQGTDYDIYLLNKYPGNPELFTSAVTNYQHKPKVFRIAELHLIKAEALAWDGTGNDAQALAALNVLRTNRGLLALTAITGDALKKEIQNERTRELLAEGTRLDDLKRWKLGVTRGLPQVSGTVLSGANASELVKPANEDKFVWAIPSRDMTTNPNLAGQQNPGW
jgi:hypothetical protein